MKKLFVLAVVFALVAGGAFAIDLGADVFGHVKVIQTDGVKQVDPDDATKEKDADLKASGGMDRLRISGAGENGDGTFGAFYRFENQHWGHSGNIAGDDGYIQTEGTAWWKPIDQLKMTIGLFRDGALGKEGWAGWMFYQMPSDAGMVNPGDVWGSGGYFPSYSYGGFVDYYGDIVPSTAQLDSTTPSGFKEDDDGNIVYTTYQPKYRDAFFGGYEINGLLLEITPADIFNINIGLPFFGGNQYANPRFVEDVLGGIMIQANLNLDFGNIALTYWGDKGPAVIDPDNDFANMGKFYLSTSITAVENLGIDFGFGFTMPVTGKQVGASYDWDSDPDTPDTSVVVPGLEDLTYQAPIQIGLGAKYDVNEAFGIKARVLMAFGEKASMKGYKDMNGDTFFGVDLLPYYAISDNVKAFFGLGMNIVSYDSDNKGYDSKLKEIDSIFGWFINPYVQIGAEWGPCIYFGVRVWSDGVTKNSPVKADQYTPVHFELPIGVQMSF